MTSSADGDLEHDVGEHLLELEAVVVGRGGGAGLEVGDPAQVTLAGVGEGLAERAQQAGVDTGVRGGALVGLVDELGDCAVMASMSTVHTLRSAMSRPSARTCS